MSTHGAEAKSISSVHDGHGSDAQSLRRTTSRNPEMRLEGYPPPPRDPRPEDDPPYDVEKGDLAGLQDGPGDGESDKTMGGPGHLEPVSESAMLSAYPDGGLKAWSVVFGRQHRSERYTAALTVKVDSARYSAALV